MRLERTFVDLRDTVRDALDIVQPTAEANDVAIVVDARTDTGDVYGDGARLQQVIVNLLSNAIKFTPQGGSVSVAVHRAGDFAELVVTDTGKGIAPEFLPWVFEPFRQADGSTTRVHAGLGLGLAIVKTLVEAHNGSVSAQSGGVGQGATFSVRLPIAIAPRRRETPARHPLLSPVPPNAMQNSLEGLSVLLVDDDDQSREIAAAHLQGCRAVVLTASSAAQGWTVLQQEHVDVLLSDIGMPDEDGYAFIRRVRALAPARGAFVPAAALTAFARDEDRQQALDAGFQLHLAKPIGAAALVSAVASLGRASRV
jgi:CheY-like chemotaxis protein